jgi:hypothetical protein
MKMDEADILAKKLFYIFLAGVVVYSAVVLIFVL